MVMNNRLKVLMAEKELRDGNHTASYRKVSEATGISTSTLYKWTSNTITSYNKEHAAKLCDFFNCKIGELFFLGEQLGD